MYVNGELQAQFMTRIRGLDPQRCLVIPVDVGKAIAMAMVADHYGEIIIAPFEFALTETGFAVLSAAISRAQNERDALIIRVGVEAAGHYHRSRGSTVRPSPRSRGHRSSTLVARLRAAGLEVVELNPRAVKDARGQQLLRTLTGRPPQCRDEALAAQAAWVAHRGRKVAAQATLANQIHGQLDLIFPGLTGCFTHGLDAASLRVLIRELPDPDRVRRLGVDGVLRYVRRRGVQMTRPMAEQVDQQPLLGNRLCLSSSLLCAMAPSGKGARWQAMREGRVVASGSDCAESWVWASSTRPVMQTPWSVPPRWCAPTVRTVTPGRRLTPTAPTTQARSRPMT